MLVWDHMVSIYSICIDQNPEEFHYIGWWKVTINPEHGWLTLKRRERTIKFLTISLIIALFIIYSIFVSWQLVVIENQQLCTNEKQ